MTLFHIEVAAEQDRAYSPQLWHRVYDTTEQEVRVNTTVIRSAVWFEGGAGEKAIKRLYSLYGGPVGTFQTLTLKDELVWQRNKWSGLQTPQIHYLL